MSRYAAGYRFERRITAHLEACGYVVVESRGSHGAADLIAGKPGRLLAVQAKGGATTMSHAEWNALVTLAARMGALPVIADRVKRKLRYRQLTGLHAFRSRSWPCEPIHPGVDDA